MWPLQELVLKFWIIWQLITKYWLVGWNFIHKINIYANQTMFLFHHISQRLILFNHHKFDLSSIKIVSNKFMYLSHFPLLLYFFKTLTFSLIFAIIHTELLTCLLFLGKIYRRNSTHYEQIRRLWYQLVAT